MEKESLDKIKKLLATNNRVNFQLCHQLFQSIGLPRDRALCHLITNESKLAWCLQEGWYEPLEILEIRYIKQWLAGFEVNILPKGISQLRHLRHFAIHDVLFLQFPEELCQLSKLEHLEIEGRYSYQSQIGENRIQKLPSSIRNLQNLYYLNLSEHDIEELPEAFGDLKNLEILHLRGNNIKTFPECLTKLSKLRELDISGTPLGNQKGIQQLVYRKLPWVHVSLGDDIPF